MKRTALVLMTMAVLFSACSSDSGDLTVEEPWARTSASMQNAGAVYMTIDGGDSSDELVAAAVPASVAMKAEIHEVTMVEGDNGTSMMSMQQVPSIPVPAGESVVLEPGGYHVMLMQLTEPLIVGSEFELTLTFAEAGDIEVMVEVRDQG